MKTMKRLALATAGAMTLLSVVAPGLAQAAGRGNNDALGVIYVESQGLFYDTFKTTDLPPKGRFQQLNPVGSNGYPSTEFGPGDDGYVGGRWWVDTNMDGVQDRLDTYFSCPLLGPGRPQP